MNLFKASRLIFVKYRLFGVILIASLMLGTMTGCATQQQVREIVKESNAALLKATTVSNEELVATTMMWTVGTDLISYPHSGLGEANKQDVWMTESAKIEAFIQAYPNQKTTAAALRLRQAMLLLDYKQFNLASAAFNMVEPQNLKTARDKSIYSLRWHLVWWFRVSDSKVLKSNEFVNADKAMEAIQDEVEKLEESPGIRDYLAEMRAWIALVSALTITNRSKAENYFEDGINSYAEIFTAEDLTELKAVSDPSTWNVSMEVLRRRLRASAIIDYAKKVIEKQGIQPELKSAVFAELLTGGEK